MNCFLTSLNFINKFIKKEHSYLTVLIEIAVLYTIYVFYKSTIIKFRNYTAYRKITQEIFWPQEQPKQESQKDKKELEKQNHQQKQVKGKKGSAHKMEETQQKQQQQQQKEKPQEQKIQQQENQLSYKELIKQDKHQKQLGKEKGTKTGAKVSHETFLGQLKGFSNAITDLAYNETLIVVSSFDQTIRVFDLQQFLAKPADPKSIFYKLHDMHASAICLSKTQHSIHFGASNQLHELQIKSKAENNEYFTLLSKTKNCHKGEINAIHISDKDKVLVTTSSDTFIKIWSLKGDLLKELNTSYGQHFGSQLSGNFLIISSQSIDTSLFELKFNPDFSFRAIEKTVILKGGKSSVIDASIDLQRTRATVANSKQVKFYKIDVDHKIKEEPKLLTTIQQQTITAATTNHELLLISDGYDLIIYDTLFQEIDKIQYAANGAIIRKIRVQEVSGTSQILCYVFGEDSDRVNLFSLTKYQGWQ